MGGAVNETPSHSYRIGMSSHMASHSGTFHPTQATLTPAKDHYSTNLLGGMEG